MSLFSLAAVGKALAGVASAANKQSSGGSSTSNTKTVNDYSKDYYAARASGDTAGMKAANDAANADRVKQGLSTQVASQDIPNVAANPSGAMSGGGSSRGDYNIGSTSGQQIAAGLPTGQSFKAADGSTWTKNANGTVSVTQSDGYFTQNAYTPVQPQQQTTPTVHTSDDINALLEEKYRAAQKQALAQSAYAVEQGTSDIRSQLQQQLPSYQAMREQSAANTQTDLDNLALRSALQGNRGGIGERQYGVVQASGQDRLLEINLEQKNLENTAAKQIADLESQGRFQDAQTVASLAQAKISELINEAQNLRNINIQQEQFNQNFGLQEANLTGYYGGNRTVAGQQFDFSKDTTIADLLGQYNGSPTLAAQQLQQQQSNTQFDRAWQLINAGLSNEQIASSLGISSAEAAQIRNNVLASNAPRATSGGGSSGSGGGGNNSKTQTTDLNNLYATIKSSGQDPAAWLTVYGSKYGLTSAGDITNIVVGYTDWKDSQSTEKPLPKAPDTSNGNISNENSANNWIKIGGTRYSMTEVEKKIDKGEIGLRQLKSGKYEYYFK